MHRWQQAHNHLSQACTLKGEKRAGKRRSGEAWRTSSLSGLGRPGYRAAFHSGGCCSSICGSGRTQSDKRTPGVAKTSLSTRPHACKWAREVGARVRARARCVRASGCVHVCSHEHCYVLWARRSHLVDLVAALKATDHRCERPNQPQARRLDGAALEIGAALRRAAPRPCAARLLRHRNRVDTLGRRYSCRRSRRRRWHIQHEHAPAKYAVPFALERAYLSDHLSIQTAAWFTSQPCRKGAHQQRTAASSWVRAGSHDT